MQQARDVLEEDGYRLFLDLPKETEEAQGRARGEYIFVRADGRHYVDLETNIVARHFSFRLNHGDVWGSAMTVPIDGREIESPSIEMLLLLLCVHGTKHVWRELIWILDIGLLVGRARKVNWRVLEEAARAAGGWRMVLLGLHLGAAIVPVALPGEVREQIDRSAVVRRLGEAVLRRLYAGDVSPVGRFRTLRFRLAARERLRDRIRYLLLLSLSPSYSDWKAVRLPARLDFLYYVVRPFRLLIKLLGSISGCWRRSA